METVPNVDSTLDPRSARSRKRLREALAEALNVLPFEHITVVLLTRRAGVNRSTFYQHYSTTEELLADLFSSRMNEAGFSDVALTSEEIHSREVPDFIHSLVAFIGERRELFRERLPRSAQHSMIVLFMEYLKDMASRNFDEQLPGLVEQDISTTSAALAGAATGVIANWLSSDDPNGEDSMGRWLWAVVRLSFTVKDEREMVAGLRAELPNVE